MSEPTHPPTVTEPTRITKPLFEAGLQCAKRLYLDFHHPDERPEPSNRRQELLQVGRELIELASGAFPKGEDLGELEFDAAAARTKEVLESGRPAVLFHAAFADDNTAVRVDVVLASAPGELDVFEVKAGTTVKPRHVVDVAFHIHAIESAGFKVRAATLLHLDPRYLHDGSKNYPVQNLFRSVDVTERARRQLERVRDQVSVFYGQLEDEGALELPTGTWCTNPLPCDYLPRCLGEGPDYPLVHMPHLTPKQESRLHEQGIEEIGDVDPTRPGLTLQQRRVIRAVQEDTLVVEPFVAAELADIDWPLAIVHAAWHLDVLPRFANTHPWQKLPFAWSMHRIEENGETSTASMVSTAADDPSAATLTALAEALKDAGTLMVYSHGLDDRLRAMLEDRGELKSQLRALLQLPLFELGNLIQHGVYHPEFRGSFDLHTVHATLRTVRGPAPGGTIVGLSEEPLEIADAEQAGEVFRRILNTRTRATTREKLGAQLDAWVRNEGARAVEVYRLLSAPVTSA